MTSLGPYDKNLTCENLQEQQCSFENFNMYISNCSKPCTIIQYTGRVDFWDDDNSNIEDSSFTLYLRFSLPLTSKVNQEYIIFDIFGLIGTVGGTFGIFIGFSCRDFLNLTTNILNKFEHQTLTRAICKVCHRCRAKSTKHDENQLENMEQES